MWLSPPPLRRAALIGGSGLSRKLLETARNFPNVAVYIDSDVLQVREGTEEWKDTYSTCTRDSRCAQCTVALIGNRCCSKVCCLTAK